MIDATTHRRQTSAAGSDSVSGRRGHTGDGTLHE
jgi:hypothetical protein